MAKEITKEEVLGLYDMYNESDDDKSLDWIVNVIADSLGIDTDAVRDLIIEERFAKR
ncbi:hypothetical protein [Leptospira stimsonii]|uniref:hypothetical protein n=1 Tax=Leptospira stimsonii TaxID=2202203 RepID=UPI0014382FBF|nr:hypothetical protein [Leptospira stimsonii]